MYLKGHAGDLLKVDRRGRAPEYVERPCLTIGLAVQPEVLRGLAGRPGFGGRGLLARFLYSLPESLVGHRQAGAPPVPPEVADRYALELRALAASLAVPAGDDGPALLALDQAAGERLLAFERDLEPRLAAGSGDLAHLAGWAAKLAGATCRLAGLLHLASHLRDGWNRPIGSGTFAGAARLAAYLVVTLSNKNGLSRIRACPGPRPTSSGPQQAAHGRPAAHLAVAHLLLVDPARSRRRRWAR